ncbi:MAG: hypothetical protein R2712_01990 [Vicinamibacterales bacterium]
MEAMNAMVNLMREHILSDARVHYVINGGRAPNVVPDFAEVLLRPSQRRVLDGIWERILNVARGAALDGTMELELTGAVWNVLPNTYLTGIMQKNLQFVGGYDTRPPSGSSPRCFASRSTAPCRPSTAPRACSRRNPASAAHRRTWAT